MTVEDFSGKMWRYLFTAVKEFMIPGENQDYRPAETHAIAEEYRSRFRFGNLH